MRNWKVWLASGGLLAVATAVGVFLLAPSAVGQGCNLASKQPDEPLEMNTAVESDLAKTVVQEK